MLADDGGRTAAASRARSDWCRLGRGNTDAYLHAHLFARYEWEPLEHVGRPVWLYEPEQFYGTEAALGARHDGFRRLIVAELAALGVATQGAPIP